MARWGCAQACLGALQHKGWSPLHLASTCERCGNQECFAIVLSLWGLLTSPVILGDKSPSHLLLAWPVIFLLTTFSSLAVMPPSQPPWPHGVFTAWAFAPCCSSPHMDIFFKTSCLENLGYHINLTHSLPASLEPCAPLSDDLLVQHWLSILGMTPLAASCGRCLLTLGPERVWDHCTIWGTAQWGDGGTPQSRSGPLVVRSRAQALNLKPLKYLLLSTCS